MCNEIYYWDIDKETGFRKLVFIFNTKFEKEIDKFIHWQEEFKECNGCNKLLPKTTYFFRSKGKDKLFPRCKACETGTNYSWGRIENYKLNDCNLHYCNRCDRILPLDEIYFFKSSGKLNRTGFESNCKECNGFSFQLTKLNEYKERLGVKEGFKICSHCNKELPDNEEYFFNSKQKNDLSNFCKSCKGIDYGIKKMNLVLKKFIPNGFEYCVHCRKLYKLNEFSNCGICKECGSKIRKIRYANNPKERLRINTFTQKRRAKQQGLINDLTVSEYNDTLKFFNHECAYCGMIEEENKLKYNQSLHQDHIIPISKDGHYTKSNIIPACTHCNISKGAKSLDEFFNDKETFTVDRYLKILDFINTYSLEEVD